MHAKVFTKPIQSRVLEKRFDETVSFNLPCLHVITNEWLQAMRHALRHVHRFFRHKEVFVCACRAKLFESFQAAAAKC